MSDYVKRASGVGDQYLAALAESQEQFLKIVEANFAFTAKLLKQQKDFTEKLVAATTPAN